MSRRYRGRRRSGQAEGRKTLRALFLFVAISVATVLPAKAHTVHALFNGKLELTIPNSYERIGDRDIPWAAKFMSIRGYGALYDSDDEVEDPLEWLAEHAATLLVVLGKMLPPEAIGPDDTFINGMLVMPLEESAEAFHDRYCESFTNRWGEYTFDVFDADSGIGVCVNVVGAFVADFTRIVGDHILVIKAIDWGEAYAALDGDEERKDFFEMTNAEKWEFYRAAANAEDAIDALKSARVLN